MMIKMMLLAVMHCFVANTSAKVLPKIKVASAQTQISKALARTLKTLTYVEWNQKSVTTSAMKIAAKTKHIAMVLHMEEIVKTGITLPFPI
jgi:prephenate dehydratase